MTTKNYGENLEAFAAGIRGWADELRNAERLFNSDTEQNPAAKIVKEIGEAILPIVQALSPIDTGLLQESHILVGPTIEKWGEGVSAQVVITIDPDPSLWNIKYGGRPSVYGPKYHAERRAWFDEGIYAGMPYFESIADQSLDLFVGIINF